MSRNVRQNCIRQALHSIAKYEQFSISSRQRLLTRRLEDRIDIITCCFLLKKLLQLFELFRIFLCQIVGLTIVLAYVV